jgi:hypothetical protein
MSTTTSRRPWFQFGLRELLWLILATASFTFAIREHMELVQERAAFTVREAELKQDAQDLRLQVRGAEAVRQELITITSQLLKEKNAKKRAAIDSQKEPGG